jgi:hypothetical protein
MYVINQRTCIRIQSFAKVFLLRKRAQQDDININAVSSPLGMDLRGMSPRPGHGFVNKQKKEAKTVAERGFISVHVTRELVDQ